MNLLNGKELNKIILQNVKEKIKLKQIKASLAIILVGKNEASKIYVNNKIKACNEVGIVPKPYFLDENINEDELCELINNLNNDSSVTGIILQSPVPSHINFDKCSSLIKHTKDVDGFTMKNIYNLYLNNETLIPCTVKGIIRMLEEYNISLEGKNVTIVGRGNIVGKPLAIALLNRNASVTILHSKSKNIHASCKNADILISAVGKPNLITSNMVKENAVVVDVGISRVDGKVVGDVCFEDVKNKCSYITPVPGGIGPMTVAMIMENILIAKEMEENYG